MTDISVFLARRRQKPTKPPEAAAPTSAALCPFHSSYDHRACALTSISLQSLVPATDVFIPIPKAVPLGSCSVPHSSPSSRAKEGSHGSLFETFARQEEALTLLDELLVEGALSRVLACRDSATNCDVGAGTSAASVAACCESSAWFPPLKLWSVEVPGPHDGPVAKRARLHPAEPEASAGAHPQGTSRRFVVASLPSFFHYLVTCAPAHRHGYEIIRTDTPCHLYFDLEYRRGRHKMKYAQMHPATPLMATRVAGAAPPAAMELNAGVDGDSLVAVLLFNIAAALRRDFGVCLRAEDVVMLCSSTELKFSRHLHVRPQIAAAIGQKVPLLWASAEHAGLWVQRLMKSLEAEHCDPLVASLWVETNEMRQVFPQPALADDHRCGSTPDAAGGASPSASVSCGLGPATCLACDSGCSASEALERTHAALPLPDGVHIADAAAFAAGKASAASAGPHATEDASHWTVVRAPIVDTGVYTRNRAMRLPFCSKLGKGIPLLPAAGNRWGLSPSLGSGDVPSSSLSHPHGATGSEEWEPTHLNYWMKAVEPVHVPVPVRDAPAAAAGKTPPVLVQSGPSAWERSLWHACLITAALPPTPLLQQVQRQVAELRARHAQAHVHQPEAGSRPEKSIGSSSSTVGSASAAISAAASAPASTPASAGAHASEESFDAPSLPASVPESFGSAGTGIASALSVAVPTIATAAVSSETGTETAPLLMSALSMVHAIGATVVTMPVHVSRHHSAPGSLRCGDLLTSAPASHSIVGGAASGGAGSTTAASNVSAGSSASSKANCSASWRLSGTVSARVQPPPFPALQAFIKCAAAGPAATALDRWALPTSKSRSSGSGDISGHTSGPTAATLPGLSLAAEVPIDRISIRAWAAAYETIRLPRTRLSPRHNAEDGPQHAGEHEHEHEPAAREAEVVRRLYLDITGSRWCNNIGRQHESNGVRWVVDLSEGKAWQTCWDRGTCGGYRSAAILCPSEVLPDQVRALCT